MQVYKLYVWSFFSANNNMDLGYKFCIHICLYNMYAFKACHKIVDNIYRRRESVTVGTTFLYFGNYSRFVCLRDKYL